MPNGLPAEKTFGNVDDFSSSFSTGVKNLNLWLLKNGKGRAESAAIGAVAAR